MPPYACVNLPGAHGCRNRHHVVRHLADSLLAQGEVAPAHVCFILLGREAGVNRGSGMPLVGRQAPLGPGNPNVDVLTLHLNELYEYVRVKAWGAAGWLPGMARWKLHLALTLFAAGQPEKSLQYCEALALLGRQCTAAELHAMGLSPLLLLQISDLAQRLMASDPRVAGAAALPEFWADEVGSAGRRLAGHLSWPD